MSVTNCLQKLGFSPEEADMILRDAGSDDPKPAIKLVKGYRDALDVERQDILRQAALPETPGAQMELPFDTLASQLPRAYQPLAREELLRNVLGEDRALKIADVMDNPHGAITPAKEPNHVNYRYVDGADDVKTVQARIAEVFAAQIEAQRGTEAWTQTQEKAADLLRGRNPNDLVGRDFTQLAAEAMAQQAMSQRAAFDLAQVASEIRAAGITATPEMYARQVQAIEMLALLHAVDQRNGAEIARALNARKAAQNVSALGKEAADLLAKYGQNPQELATKIGELGSADQLARFARDASKATTWEKIVEAWKAALVSGPITQIANLMGNVTFLAARPLVDVTAAATSVFRSGPNRVTAAEPLARVIGNIHGTIDGARAAWYVLRTGDTISAKTEAHRKAIEGTLGEIVRTPFRLLSATDAFFRTINERGEAYALATREAAREGLNPATREFQQRVADLARDPTDAMRDQIEAAGQRFTFQAPLPPGSGSRSRHRWVRGGAQFSLPSAETTWSGPSRSSRPRPTCSRRWPG